MNALRSLRDWVLWLTHCAAATGNFRTVPFSCSVPQAPSIEKILSWLLERCLKEFCPLSQNRYWGRNLELRGNKWWLAELPILYLSLSPTFFLMLPTFSLCHSLLVSASLYCPLGCCPLSLAVTHLLFFAVFLSPTSPIYYFIQTAFFQGHQSLSYK